MKTKLVCALSILALALTGCVSNYQLPAINAAEFNYRRTDPAGGTAIKAQNVRIDGATVKADYAQWVTTYPQCSLAVEIKGYERKIEKTETTQTK